MVVEILNPERKSCGFKKYPESYGRGLRAWGPFLESPDNERARQAVSVYIKDRGFNSFASNMIKLSVNETKWSSLLARTRALILYISI